MSNNIENKETEALLTKEELEEQLKNLPVMAELEEEAEEFTDDEEEESEELLDEDYSREDGEEESLDELLKRINNREKISEKAGEFTIATDIGKKDYRDFFYYNTLMKSNLFLALYIVIPFALSYLFTGINSFDLVTFLIYAVIFAVLEAGIIIFMTELKIKKIEKAMPDTMKVTRTVYKFISDGIVHTKNGETTKARYSDIVLFRTTKQKVILYFSNKKAMVIHIDDIEKVMPFENFKVFIEEKAF